jgi:hypothetical protein
MQQVFFLHERGLARCQEIMRIFAVRGHRALSVFDPTDPGHTRGSNRLKPPHYADHGANSYG